MVESKFELGQFVCVRGFTSVWTEDLGNSRDFMVMGEIATVIDGDEYGWVKVLAPRGAIGLIHSSNLEKL